MGPHGVKRTGAERSVAIATQNADVAAFVVDGGKIRETVAIEIGGNEDAGMDVDSLRVGDRLGPKGRRCRYRAGQ